MSLAITPPEQGRRCATAGVVAHNVNRATFAFRVDGDVLVVCFSIAQNRYPDGRPANSEYQSVNVHV